MAAGLRNQAALIGDIVGSRSHPNQDAMIQALTRALDWANDRTTARQKLEVTVGDEFQGAYASLGDALDAGLFVRLRLGRRFDLRVGIGWGKISAYDPKRAPMAQSGSAWWAAREAIDRTAELVKKHKWPRGLRTLLGGEHASIGALNAFVICRDALLDQMDDEDFRITLALFEGESQEAVASALSVSQPTVAYRQREKGAASVYRAHQALRDLAR